MLAVTALEALGPDGVDDLLRLRPDLAVPRASLRDLAARAVQPGSLSVALRAFDTPTLQVAEVLAAREGPARGRTLEALLLAAMPVGSLRAGLTALGVSTKKTLKADLVAVLTDAVSDADLIRATVAQAPPAIAARIRRAAFGERLPRHFHVNPYSLRLYRGGIDKDPTLWAVAHLLAVQTYEGVVLPAEVALALRGPDWHAEFAYQEPALVWGPPSPSGDDGAAAAGQAVRIVTGVLEALSGRPLQRLTTGAVGVRELRRLAKEQRCTDGDVRLALSLANHARLLTSAPRSVGVHARAKPWLRLSPAARAANLMSQWLQLPETPGLDPGGSWSPRGNQRLLDLKASVFATLAERPGRAPEAGSLLRRLAWAHPVVVMNRISALAASADREDDRDDWDDWDDPDGWDDLDDDIDDPAGDTRDATQTLLDAVLGEATWLGIVAGGALTTLGAAVIQGDGRQVETALESALGPAATRARLQADLTAVVLGHPGADLSATLDALADRESRSVATTWRFTPATVRRAMDAGWDADTVLARLAAIAEGPVPQPLAYLVSDVGRRHGHLRGGSVTCYLRSDDAALVREVAADRRVARLGLRVVADGVLVGDKPLGETLEALRAAGYAPIEDSEGRSGG